MDKIKFFSSSLVQLFKDIYFTYLSKNIHKCHTLLMKCGINLMLKRTYEKKAIDLNLFEKKLKFNENTLAQTNTKPIQLHYVLTPAIE